jgi:GNAT superfamily N-acetyltransferase/predicted kinase
VGCYGHEVPRLVLVNGAPGSGKSTIADALAQDEALTLALDVDGLKHSLGRWEDDPTASGVRARRLALAVAADHLQAGFDVVVGQYLARTAFIEDLEQLAERHGAVFHEFVLSLDADALATRLAGRSGSPDRPEHAVNNRLVGPDDATALVQSLEPLRELRPRAIWVDASGPVSATLGILRAVLAGPAKEAPSEHSNGGHDDPVSTVRTAVPADQPELQRIYRSASLSNPGDAPMLLSRPEFLHFAGARVAEGDTRVAVGDVEGMETILGFATVTEGDSGEPELEDLFVDPRWRRRGVARRLVEDAVQTLRTSGQQRLWVTGNPHAAAFYAAAGFVGSERVTTELGAGWRLHLDLD